MNTININLTDTAKIIRKVLKETFPSVKFSVRCSRFSCGSSIDVHWAEGAKYDDVKEAIGFFEAGRFNGMDDCYDYTDHASKDGTVFHFGNKYLCISREFDKDKAKKALDRANAEAGTRYETFHDMVRAGWQNVVDYYEDQFPAVPQESKTRAIYA